MLRTYDLLPWPPACRPCQSRQRRQSAKGMVRGVSGPPDNALAWYQLDPARLQHEAKRLKSPWRLVLEPDGRYAWHGGSIEKRRKGQSTGPRSLRLIYPPGFPA